MSKPEAVSRQDTLKIRDACLCLHVQRAARSLARLFDEAFRPVGITQGQFSLLNALNRPAPARIRDVAALLAMDRTTLTASLKPLQRRGLVTITVDPGDRRGKLLSLTDEGRRTLAVAFPIWVKTHAKLEKRLERPAGLRADLVALA